MKVNWLIKTSKSAHLLAITLSLIPFLLTIILEQQLRYFWLIWLLTPVLYYLLIKQFNLSILNHKALLSYQNGLWFYRDSKTSFFGSLSGKSFAYGFIIFLQLKNDGKQRVDLWLFADSIVDRSPKWRQLQSCFNLSGQT